MQLDTYDHALHDMWTFSRDYYTSDHALRHFSNMGQFEYLIWSSILELGE